MGLFGPPNVDKMKAKRDVEGLIKALGCQKDVSVRNAAANALGQIGTPAVEPLIAALKDSDSNVRNAAAGALGQIGDVRAVEPLIAALKEDWQVRRAAADALDKIGWRPSQNESDAAYWVAKREWNKCIEIGAPTVEPLIAALKNEDWDVWRAAAAGALGQIGDARAVEPLIAALKDIYKDVRQAAAGALRQIGASAVEPLIAALKDSDEDVRQAAAGVLDNLGWRPSQDERGAAYWVVKQQWDKCIEIGAPAVASLIAASKTSYKAVEALGKIGDARALVFVLK